MNVWLHALIDLADAVEPNALQAWLQADGGRAIAQAGGSLWGLYSGAAGLGLASHQRVLMTVWSDDGAAGAAIETLHSAPCIASLVGTPLRATVRPPDPTPPAGDGIWVFREFEIEAAESARFIELSEAAWPSFEQHFDARIAGLFRGPDPSAGRAHLQLVTRYADLQTWEASRSQDADPEAWANFNARRALTHWSRAVSTVRIEP